jgi:predicted phage terminase large subunit-like protein
MSIDTSLTVAAPMMEPTTVPPSPRLLALLAGELARAIARRASEAYTKMPLSTWGRLMLPAYFRLPPSGMHLWLGEQLDAMDSLRGARLNVLGPRGGAKSTVGTLCYVLKCAVTAREPYIWIVSDTIGQARMHLANVKAELEHNPLLATYYPQAVGPGPRWRADAAELPNGVLIEAYGTGQRLRGRRRRENRPTLIVCDDLQNDAHVASATQRQVSRDWFHGALLKAGDGRTNVINLATALHRDALAMQLVRSPGWNSRVFRAIEKWPENLDLWGQWEELYADVGDFDARAAAREFFQENRDAMLAGAELLWPEHEDLYSLMRMRFEEGRTAFEREKQNSPIDPERCEWPEEYFGPHIWFSDWPRDLAVKTIALDPSKGSDARHGDYSAYAMLGIDRHGLLYVEADMARRPTPQMVADGVNLCQRFPPEAFGIEVNQYQELLGGEFEAEFRRRHKRVITPAGICNATNKLVRIRRLGPYLSQHRLRFHAKSPATRLLVDQLRDFPLGAHDDGPDALEMAIRLAIELLSGNAMPSDGLGDNLLTR